MLKIKQLERSRTGSHGQGHQSPTSMFFLLYNLSSNHIAVLRWQGDFHPPASECLIPKGFKMQSQRLSIKEGHWDVGRFPRNTPTLCACTPHTHTHTLSTTYTHIQSHLDKSLNLFLLNRQIIKLSIKTTKRTNFESDIPPTIFRTTAEALKGLHSLLPRAQAMVLLCMLSSMANRPGTNAKL